MADMAAGHRIRAASLKEKKGTQSKRNMMYAYIKGTLVTVSEEQIVVENQGIGYSIRVPASMLDDLPSVGAEVKIYTYLYVREDIFCLYGFLSNDDLNLFKMLINVNGIGPKGALAILSVLSADDLRFAVLADDAKTIAKAPGIGNKTAQRLIIELKDKLKLEEVFEHSYAKAGDVNIKESKNRNKNEAVEALTALGYSASDALKVLSDIPAEDMEVEDILKAALKKMAFI